MYSLRRGGMAVVCAVVTGCQMGGEEASPRTVNLYQDWALQPGDPLGGYTVQSGLGDVAVDMQGQPLYMPFDGQVKPDADRQQCLVVSSPQVPAYLFRLCGVKRPRLGQRQQGEMIGRGQLVAFATLRKQQDGTWAMVEPAQDLLEQFVQ